MTTQCRENSDYDLVRNCSNVGENAQQALACIKIQTADIATGLSLCTNCRCLCLQVSCRETYRVLIAQYLAIHLSDVGAYETIVVERHESAMIMPRHCNLQYKQIW